MSRLNLSHLGISRLRMGCKTLLKLGIGATTWMSLATAGYASCELFSVPQQFNTQTVNSSAAETVIVIGPQPDRPYRVVVSSTDRELLAEIKGCVLDALITSSRLGDYILVGSFDRRGDAETINRIMRNAGYPSRVTYGR